MRYPQGALYSNFSGFRRAKDSAMTRDIMLHELSNAIVNRREDVIDELNKSGIPTDSSISPKDLSDSVMNNLHNKNFLYGLSLILAKKHKDEFQNFVSTSTKKGEKVDVIGDVADEMKKLNGDDKTELQERVEMFHKEANDIPESRKTGGLIMLGVISLSALAIYLVSIAGTGKLKLIKQ